MNAKERKESRSEIRRQLISTTETLKVLDISAPRLSQLTNRGVLQTIERGVFLKADILAYKKAFDEARLENKWLKDFE